MCSLDMPAAARLEIHTARVEEVVAWKEREGPDEYLKLVEGRKVSILQWYLYSILTNFLVFHSYPCTS